MASYLRCLQQRAAAAAGEREAVTDVRIFRAGRHRQGSLSWRGLVWQAASGSHRGLGRRALRPGDGWRLPDWQGLPGALTGVDVSAAPAGTRWTQPLGLCSARQALVRGVRCGRGRFPMATRRSSSARSAARYRRVPDPVAASPASVRGFGANRAGRAGKKIPRRSGGQLSSKPADSPTWR